jgi:polysaccharide chain length determinant protein (PEP-CTERM system associated)
MQEVIAQIYGYLLGVWRHRWLALGVAWVVALAGWAYVWQLPESYVATARIYVDSNQVLRPLMRGLAITPDIDQRISMMSRTLLSRPNLEKLGRMTDLDLQATTEAQKSAMVERLKQAVSIGGTRGNESLYSIRVVDRDRDLARRIAQSLITVFIETSLSDKRADSSGAERFLSEQIAESEKRLIDAENRLARFKQEHVDVLPGGGGDYYSRLEKARGALAQARLELRELENRRAELQGQVAGEEPVFLGSTPAQVSSTPLDARIQSLEAKLDSLLLRYTAKHPEVRQLQALIEELEAERDAQYSDLPGSGGGLFSAAGASPVYQGMRSMLAETEARIAELKVRVAEFERRVEALVSKVSSIPEVEAQLKQLDRDYGVLTSRHQDLLSRREAARLSGDVEGSAGDVSFRVVDPPYVPQKPSEPNKLLLNAGVLVVALGAGVALALGLSLIHPIVTDGRMLANVVGMPLLGTVTFNKTDERRRRDRWRLASFCACTAALFVGFAGIELAPVWLA